MGSGILHLRGSLLVAQIALASLTGIIRDGDRGTPLPEVVVSLVEQNRIARTDSSGVYSFVNVAAGPQHMIVQRIGYSPRTLHALVPREGVLTIDVALHAEPIPLAEVNVRAPVPVRGLDDTESPAYPDRGLSMAAVRHHPILAEPDALQAAGGGEITLDPESPNGLHIRGGSADQVAYLLDGIPVLNPYHAAGTFTAWNPDALSRIDLFTSGSPMPCPDALAGVVAASTLDSGPRFRTQGGVSSSQARMTVDGPLGPAGLLLSARTAFPGLLLRGREGSYLSGEGSDWLGKIESPFLSGWLQLLTVGSETDVETAGAAETDSLTGADPRRNAFGWDSDSFGASWGRRFAVGTLHFRSWAIRGNAEATWSVGDSLPAELRSLRRDYGMAAAWDFGGPARSTTVGIRAQHTHTRYDLRSLVLREEILEYETRDPVTAGFLEHRRSLGSNTHVETTLLGTLLGDDPYFSPSAQLRWDAFPTISITAGYARRHQFVQSLQSSESVMGNIFPADLSVGSSPDGVPVARSHQGVLAVEVRPASGVRFGAQVYARDFDQLALVAPQDGDPFATSGFVRGAGTAKGVAVEAGANSARYGILASYGYQDSDLTYETKSYVPEYSAGHSIDTGLIVFPSATSSVRIGLQSAFGRRGTTTIGGFEWEACNLLDPGCEVAGNPGRSETLGGERLPAYFRVDIGARKHWHMKSWGRDWMLELFGTATNLLSRKNVLTVAVEPSTGRRTQIEMRPLSPLVVGLDWRF